jgi:protocatechuate 3,4-dioxygenase beta subunit
VLGCTPISDDARLTITGTVLNEDGTPAADQEVELFKADLPTLDSD